MKRHEVSHKPAMPPSLTYHATVVPYKFEHFQLKLQLILLNPLHKVRVGACNLGISQAAMVLNKDISRRCFSIRDWCCYTVVHKEAQRYMVKLQDRCLKLYGITKEVQVWRPLKLPVICNQQTLHAALGLNHWACVHIPSDLGPTPIAQDKGVILWSLCNHVNVSDTNQSWASGWRPDAALQLL